MKIEANGCINHTPEDYHTPGKCVSLRNNGVAGWMEPPQASVLTKKVVVCCCFKLLDFAWPTEVVDSTHIRLDGELFERVEKPGGEHGVQAPTVAVEIERA